MNDKYPPLTTAALVPYSSLSSFSEVVPAEKMAELEKWAHKAAQELVGHTNLVDWRANSKRLCEQIEGSDAIGYEWGFWHKQQDEGRAAKERIIMLFDEYRKLTA